MYLDDLALAIRRRIPEDRLPNENVDELMRSYAVLLRAKGTDVTSSDVHDVWAAWTAGRQQGHEALVPYDDLPEHVRKEDAVFVDAIRQVAHTGKGLRAPRQRFLDVLFPAGLPISSSAKQEVLELYKIIVQSSEDLVNRRQAVNTFFLTINGALVTAYGIIVQTSRGHRFAAGGIVVLAAAGVILCGAWRSLISSFGQLNRGKFDVINTIEQQLSAAIYSAEWEALGRGENSKTYRSFTSREIWVPNALMVLHVVAALIGAAIACGVVEAF